MHIIDTGDSHPTIVVKRPDESSKDLAFQLNQEREMNNKSFVDDRYMGKAHIHHPYVALMYTAKFLQHPFS